jgi:hypothetical protein
MATPKNQEDIPLPPTLSLSAFGFGRKYPIPQSTTNVYRFRTNNSDGESKLDSLIISICSGSSFDDLYHRIKPETEDGKHIDVYRMTPSSAMYTSFMKLSKDPTAKVDLKEDSKKNLLELLKGIQSLSDNPDSVIFNWECCSGCNDKGFCVSETIIFLKFLLDHGHGTMFSDFSLKALIGTWDEELLGPCPFARVGTFSNSMNLVFNPKNLLDCPSQQLQIVGKLSTNGICAVSAMSSTILYAVDHTKLEHDKYILNNLSMVTGINNTNVEGLESFGIVNVLDYPKAEYEFKINFDSEDLKESEDDDDATIKNKKSFQSIAAMSGFAGHTFLGYPTGGYIITSCGHWIELMNLGGVSENALREVSGGFGISETESCDAMLSSCNTQEEKDNALQTLAQQYVCRASSGSNTTAPKAPMLVRATSETPKKHGTSD